MSPRGKFSELPLLRCALIAAVAGYGCGGENERPRQPPDAASSSSSSSSSAASAAAADTNSAQPTGAATSDDGIINRESWSAAPIGREAMGGHAILMEVRMARHEGFDRVVFEFEAETPGYEIRYVPDPVACGSGHAVDAGAPVTLEVRLRSAAAHDEAGQPTVAEREREPGYPMLRTARITCDFEGYVTWALGVERRAPLRVLELTSPARLVLDLRHR